MNEFSATPMSSVDEIRMPAEMSLTVCDDDEITELSEDFSLPDYQPEIKRLLRINTSVLPPARYVTADGVELTGNMDYFVLYVGNDDGLYCAPLSAEYRARVPLQRDLPSFMAPEDLSRAVVLCDTVTEAVSGRVTAPRRLNLKTRLRSRVKAYAPFVPDSNLPHDEPVEQLTEQLPVARPDVAMSQLIPLQDDVILPPSDHGDMRVICAEGQVMITEAATAPGAVNCRGEVTVKLMLAPSSSADMEDAAENETATHTASPAMPTVIFRKIPFTHSVEMMDAAPDGTACAHGRCAELSVEMEDGHLHVDLGVILEAMTERNQMITYTKDLFSARRETRCRHTEIPVVHAIRCLNGNFTLSDSLPLSDVGIDPAAKVVDVTATASPDELSLDDRRCVLNGSCHCHLLLCKDGEYTSADMTMPFRYEMDTRSATPLPSDAIPLFNGHVSVPACRVRMDGERIGIDAELAVALRLAARQSMTVLSEVAFGDDVTRRSGEYVICFPAPSDTLWSVAKRYHAPLAPLAAANNLSTTDALDGVGYLIV